jgi:hypothetical protein
MKSDEWNKRDAFKVYLYSPDNPLERGFEGLEEVLDLIESLDDELRPDGMYVSPRRRKYSRQALRKHLPEATFNSRTAFTLDRSNPPEVSFYLRFWEGNKDERFSIALRISPFSFVRKEDRSGELARRLVSLVRAFAERLPISYGLGHSYTDFCMGSDPHSEDPFTPQRVYEAYWLNVYGSRMVEEVGRERVLSTPAAHLEELPGGSVLWLTRPTPADFDSEEARLAQARALVHLRSEPGLETVLASLRERSLAFTPVPMNFDEDVAEILKEEVEFRGLSKRRQMVEQFNTYRPPPVSEWVPAAQVPEPDVEDVRHAIEMYEGHYAEQLIALMHAEKVPSVMEGSLEALPRVDYHLWHFSWGERLPEEKEELVPALGAWLGMYLVHTLGGRWVPRRKLEEAAVVVGDRAWLPFLRARHTLQGRDAPLDYSCTQFFRQAQRLAHVHGQSR